MKNMLKLMISKKLLTDLTSAWTLKVCYIYNDDHNIDNNDDEDEDGVAENEPLEL